MTSARTPLSREPSISEYQNPRDQNRSPIQIFSKDTKKAKEIIRLKEETLSPNGRTLKQILDDTNIPLSVTHIYTDYYAELEGINVPINIHLQYYKPEHREQ